MKLMELQEKELSELFIMDTYEAQVKKLPLRKFYKINDTRIDNYKL